MPFSLFKDRNLVINSRIEEPERQNLRVRFTLNLVAKMKKISYKICESDSKMIILLCSF